ncbi:hypothetical protein [Natronobiforma cellulositropha]|nr:hypothetical protein [Natronobiforma cellulositropha]
MAETDELAHTEATASARIGDSVSREGEAVGGERSSGRAVSYRPSEV